MPTILISICHLFILSDFLHPVIISNISPFHREIYTRKLCTYKEPPDRHLSIWRFFVPSYTPGSCCPIRTRYIFNTLYSLGKYHTTFPAFICFPFSRHPLFNILSRLFSYFYHFVMKCLFLVMKSFS